MKNIYLSLTIIGAVLPYLFFFQFIQIEGVNVPLFISSLFVNGASAGFTVDLLMSSIVFWAFMFQKGNSGPKPSIFIVLNLYVGLSCALPAYLYAVENKKWLNK